MVSSFIAKQIRAGEGQHTEFKSDARAVDTIARTVCAFLNTQGGTIFCGVSDDGIPTGLADAEGDRTWLESRLQKAISPKALFTMSVELIAGAPVVIIEVPEGKDRPYVHAGAVYVRQRAVTRAADARTLRSLVQNEAAQTERWERRTSPALELEDLDGDEIESTVREAQTWGRYVFGTDHDARGVLGTLAMLTATGFTNAADVVFSKLPARRQPQCRIRVIRFETEKSGDTFLNDQWFDGPLVRSFETAFAAVSTQVPVQHFFPTGQVRREERPQYALEALREGLVNAVAHRDYASFSGGVTVSIYPGRIEIWNSGRLPSGLQPSDLKGVHPSIPTNPDISHVLYLRRLMEKIGRGTQKIIAASKELGAPSPRWTDKPSGVTLTLFAARESSDAALGLNLRQLELLRGLNAGDQVHPLAYTQSLEGNVSERQARRDLSLLEEAGFLIRRGAARATYYERTDREI
ncbi:RNA-binding domain-containing protein [Sphingomonas glacialis]|uniref:RNA-binding domain-containing protein n=1 Tax=Sphingomonas glacialis TaxID=658225 RepID=UPI00112986A4|nr:RNA-binding domain-containing protein [Sphingomonas glacialis]